MNVSAPRKVLVLELAGLGDGVHLLPALWQLRQHWPDAELHVMVSAGVTGLFQLTPWLQKVWAYPTNPKPGLAGNWRWGTQLRAERYDCVINTTGGDRASLLTWLTRAPRRVGRRPSDGGPPGWRRLFTETLDIPYWIEPMFAQKLRCAAALGCDVPASALHAPHFEIVIDPALRVAAGVTATDEHRYFHISPFTTAAARELPLTQIAELIGRLGSAFPQLRVALSCAPSGREIERMDQLLDLLPAAPWRVWKGTLTVPGLAAVIEKSALNFSGDTGSLHVALMTGTPAVAWFRSHRGEREWIPPGSRSHVLIAPGGAADALHGIDTGALVSAAADILAVTGTR